MMALCKLGQKDGSHLLRYTEKLVSHTVVYKAVFNLISANMQKCF